MAIKPNIVMARVKKINESVEAKNTRREYARSQAAKIINEESSDGFVTRTQGNESINVEAFTPNENARSSRRMTSSLTITVDGGKMTLNGRNARTLYRVLANHFGANISD
jgi:hypothetical protein